MNRVREGEGNYVIRTDRQIGIRTWWHITAKWTHTHKISNWMKLANGQSNKCQSHRIHYTSCWTTGLNMTSITFICTGWRCVINKHIVCVCVCVCWIKLTRSCENETNTRMERKRRQQQLNRNETSWICLFRVYRNKRMNLKHCHSVYTLACDFVYVEIFISFYLYYSSVSLSHSLPLMSARLVLVVCVRARESIQNRKRMKRRRRRNKKNNKNSDTATQPNDSRRFSGWNKAKHTTTLLNWELLNVL